MQMFRLVIVLIAGSAVLVGCGGEAPTAPIDSGKLDAGRTETSGQEVLGNDAGVEVTPDVGAPAFEVKGSVSGLLGTALVLEINAGQTVNITADGAFAFATPLPRGAVYAVTVKTQPSNPQQTCTVANGTGAIAAAPVINVAVTCTSDRFVVGGTLNGLAGTGLVLRNNGGDDVQVNANGAFAFSTAIDSGSAYAVSVQTQPSAPSQTCTVSMGTGAVTNGDIDDVVVTCVTNRHIIGGSISGLAPGATVVLQDNGTDAIERDVNGPFVFLSAIASGAPYAVTVLTHPASPVQTCVVANGDGTVGVAPVTTISVVCTTTTFAVGGNVVGLVGANLVLRNNGGDDLPIATAGGFMFASPVASGAAYAVTVHSQPTAPSQTCSVTTGAGTVADAEVTNVVVTCTTSSFTVGGLVTGLTGSGLVLRNNGGGDLAVISGGFTFASPVPSGLGYSVTVMTQPASPTQACVVTNGTGTVGGANITNVTVSCVNSSGSGSDGALTVSGAVVINTIAAAATGTTGETTLTLASGTGFAAGQTILIHQSQGTNAGDWERATVASVAGDVLTLAQPLAHTYESGGASNHAQAIVSPQYTDVTVPLGDSLSAPPWNGTTGGILVFNATGAITIAGTVSMTGKGFRGGIGESSDPGSVAFKAQGESHTGLGANGLTTNVANAGGGNGGAKQGGCEGGGGGGGAHATNGGNGGPHETCFPIIEGGVGGTAYGDATLTKIFFGSGGGAGGYSGDPTLGRGGNGGGIVMIFGELITISSSIDAMGDDGTLEFGDYGGGGGGGGGSVYLSHTQPIVGTSNVAGGVGGLANGRSEVGGAGGIGRVLGVP